MEHITIVYGNIIGAPWKTHDYHKLQHLNKNYLLSLPVTDTYPWIHRNMFNVPDPDNIEGTYRDQVITFGASYKAVEHEWHKWLEKFETILRQLYWSSATIHLDTELVGRHTYEWIFDSNQPDNWIQTTPNLLHPGILAVDQGSFLTIKRICQKYCIQTLQGVVEKLDR